MRNKWFVWMREKGSWSIAHLLKETKGKTDITVCGMKYNNTLGKKEWDFAKCIDCFNGNYNKKDIRSSMPVHL